MSVDLIVRDVRRRGDARPVDLAVAGGRIVAVGAGIELDAPTVLDGAGGLVLPGLVNAHQHIDKALIGDAFRPVRWPGWAGCRAVNRAHRDTYTVQSIVERGVRVIEMALANGTTALRAFADIEPIAGTTGVRALVALRERYAGEVRVQVCPFPQDVLYDHPDGEALLEAAMDAGADVVGGFPSGEATDDRMRRHVDFCLDLARRRDADVHMLLDDSDDPAHRSLEYLALRVIDAGWEGRVTVGHAGALSAYDEPHAEMVVGRVADAGISVCVNSHISLVLQGRHDRGPVRRGITRARELMAAGVNVLAGQDDIDDPYYPLGRGDQLEVAQYAAHVCHLAWPEELEVVVDMVCVNAARAMRLDGVGLAVGDRADLVVAPEPTTLEVLRALSPRRFVIAGGRLVAEATVNRRRLPR